MQSKSLHWEGRSNVNSEYIAKQKSWANHLHVNDIGERGLRERIRWALRDVGQWAGVEIEGVNVDGPR